MDIVNVFKFDEKSRSYIKNLFSMVRELSIDAMFKIIEDVKYIVLLKKESTYEFRFYKDELDIQIGENNITAILLPRIGIDILGESPPTDYSAWERYESNYIA